MSAWRITLRELHEAGGAMCSRKMMHGTVAALQYLRYWGLVTGPGRGGWREEQIYRLTPLGRKVAQGKAVPMSLPRTRERDGSYNHQHDRKFVATWLAALPDANEIRLMPCDRY
jgi:hypothetical protein